MAERIEINTIFNKSSQKFRLKRKNIKKYAMKDANYLDFCSFINSGYLFPYFDQIFFFCKYLWFKQDKGISPPVGDRSLKKKS